MKKINDDRMITVQVKLVASISNEFDNIMSHKEKGENFTYTDGQTVTNVVSGFFLKKNLLG